MVIHFKSGIASRNENCKWFLLTTKAPTSAVASFNITIPKNKQGETQKPCEIDG